MRMSYNRISFNKVDRRGRQPWKRDRMLRS
jgi:hypothetical protein